MPSNLPPGCSHADIERAMGGSDPSPESEEALEILENGFNSLSDLIEKLRENDARLADDSDRIITLQNVTTGFDKVCEIIDKLVNERDHFRNLLSAAEYRIKQPKCTCRAVQHVGAEHFEWCPANPAEPSLKDEIRTALGLPPIPRS